MSEILKISLAQIAPVWLNRTQTTDKVCDYINLAGNEHSDLVIFGEALLPGYPFWVEHTGGAAFENDIQKEIYGHYVNQAVRIERGDLKKICESCKSNKTACYLGIIEQPSDRGKSLYCSLVYIDKKGDIKSVHRKIMPTYEERLVWSPGDGHGLVTHDLTPFTVGGLNCWENWLPLARASLYAQGEDLHISVWPGNLRNTEDLIPVIAKESRSYVVAVAGLFTESQITQDLPQSEIMKAQMKGTLANGGSCVANPDGSWLMAPVTDKEGLFHVALDHAEVRRSRLTLDTSGHYSRPDIFSLDLNTERQTILHKSKKP